MYPDRIVSGMRPNGAMHLGHYHGVLKNWIRMQTEMPCLFFVADWQGLTTHYNDPSTIEEKTWEMLIDWLAAGVDPSQATLFIQSKVPEHAELHLLLSMATPLTWLEHVASNSAEKELLSDHDLATYALLGSPILQASDVLIYRASLMPVISDQARQVDMIGELARRFNHLFGEEKGFEEKAQVAVKKLGSKRAKLYQELRNQFQKNDDADALAQAKAMLEDTQNLSMIDRERLFGYLEGSRKLILVEPHAKLMETVCLPGLDGQKMSRRLGNSIALRENKESLVKKLRSMPTDPAKIHRSDIGDPEKCAVWKLHQVYSDTEVKKWVMKSCKSASIACLECKQPLIDAIIIEQEPMCERAQQYLDDPSLVRAIVADGCDHARKLAQETMREVREVMGLNYS